MIGKKRNDQVKYTNIGIVFLLVGAIIYGSTLIAASLYIQEGIGTDFYYGVFKSSLRTVGTYPAILSVLVGMIFLIIAMKKHK